MQTSYARNYTEAVQGQPACVGPFGSLARSYALLPQIGTITIGGTASDGNYVATFTDPDTGAEISVTVVRSTTPATNNDIAAALAAAINDAANGVSHLVTATVASAVVTYTALRAGEVIAVATSETTATGTIVAAVTQAATAANIPVGIMAAQSTDDGDCRLPASGDTAADLIGVVYREPGAIRSNDGSSGADEFRQGETLDLMTRGEVWVLVEEAVSPDDAVYCRVVAGGSEQAGAFRTDADGSDAVLLSGAKFRSTTTGAGIAKLALNLP